VTDNRDEGFEVEIETPSVEASASASSSTGSPGIRDVIQRTLMLGIGAAALTVDRVQAVTDEFVRRGQLTADEGRDMVEDLTNSSRRQTRTVMRRLDTSMQGTYRELGLATRQELEDLDFRLRQVEHRLGLLERHVDTTPPSYEEEVS
jgi:polyhydroxyalkanoate synthesis regulator phasin